MGGCTKNIGNATLGYPVYVDVVITYNGLTYTALTYFIPV